MFPSQRVNTGIMEGAFWTQYVEVHNALSSDRFLSSDVPRICEGGWQVPECFAFASEYAVCTALFTCCAAVCTQWTGGRGSRQCQQQAQGGQTMSLVAVPPALGCRCSTWDAPRATDATGASRDPVPAALGTCTQTQKHALTYLHEVAHFQNSCTSYSLWYCHSVLVVTSTLVSRPSSGVTYKYVDSDWKLDLLASLTITSNYN